MSNLNAANFFYINCIIQILSLSKKKSSITSKEKKHDKKVMLDFFSFNVTIFKTNKRKNYAKI